MSVGMTAAMLVLEPIYEADLPSEQYAYRAGRNAQQAMVEVEEVLCRSHPDVVDADLADYFGSSPQPRRFLGRRLGADRSWRPVGVGIAGALDLRQRSLPVSTRLWRMTL